MKKIILFVFCFSVLGCSSNFVNENKDRTKVIIYTQSKYKNDIN